MCYFLCGIECYIHKREAWVQNVLCGGACASCVVRVCVEGTTQVCM